MLEIKFVYISILTLNVIFSYIEHIKNTQKIYLNYI